MVYRPGQIIKFTYRSHIGLKPHEVANDFKEIFVLHPLWAGKVHGIDLKRLTQAEREVLITVMDPEQKGRPHRIPLVNDILRRMDPIEEIKNPMAFYSKFVKPYIRNKDVYRTYYPNKMISPSIQKESTVKGSVFNPTPLFKK